MWLMLGWRRDRLPFFFFCPDFFPHFLLPFRQKLRENKRFWKTLVRKKQNNMEMSSWLRVCRCISFTRVIADNVGKASSHQISLCRPLCLRQNIGENLWKETCFNDREYSSILGWLVHLETFERNDYHHDSSKYHSTINSTVNYWSFVFVLLLIRWNPLSYPSLLRREKVEVTSAVSSKKIVQ